MRSFYRIILLSITALSLFACSTSRKAGVTVTPKVQMPSYATDYLNKYSAMAVSEMKRTGIPASITMAQAMLESDYGRSSLARKGNNHFGIKCHNGWKGGKIYHDDEKKNECFRSYRNAEESFRDHSDFLVNGSRYADLFRLKSTDYRGWAHGLKKAGYATNPRYPALLIQKIEDYGLHALDDADYRAERRKEDKSTDSRKEESTGQVGTKSNDGGVQTVIQENDDVTSGTITLPRGRIQENNNVQFIIVQEGDSYKSLAEEFSLLSWEISRYNELPADAELVPGQIIYLQPKRNKAAIGLAIHVVKEGETMYSISQKYGMKLSSLYKMNVMEEGTECVTGEKIRIR